MEALVLKRLQGIHQICEFIGCGKTGKANYLVMSLLGPNLSELRKKQTNHKFTISTVLRLGVQIIKVVQSMHSCGFLHRDLKPSNFAMGIGSHSKTCFLLDFGLSRQYIMPTGELKQPRPIAGFRGTVRYASISAHTACELGRHDDLWSVFYLLVELATGQLPWRSIHEKEEVRKAKLSCDHDKLITHLPKEIGGYLEYLNQLTYYDKPNYLYLIAQLELAQERLGINQSALFDWEHDRVNSQTTTTIVVSVVEQSCHDKVSINDDLPPTTLQAQVNVEVEKSSHNRSICTSAPVISDKKDCIHHLDDVNMTTASTQSKLEGKTATIELKSQVKEEPSLIIYAIPLPPEPKPDRYYCATTRRNRFVKCRTPHA